MRRLSVVLGLLLVFGLVGEAMAAIYPSAFRVRWQSPKVRMSEAWVCSADPSTGACVDGGTTRIKWSFKNRTTHPVKATCSAIMHSAWVDMDGNPQESVSSFGNPTWVKVRPLRKATATVLWITQTDASTNMWTSNWHCLARRIR